MEYVNKLLLILLTYSTVHVKTFAASDDQDTLQNRQSLYSGKVWVNYYNKFEGHPFLFQNYFLHGKVFCKARELKVKIRYDIYKDEIMIPFGDEILQLNKEAVDSFTINYNNRLFRFIKADTSGGSGFYNVINLDKAVIRTTFKKDIFPSSDKGDVFEFVESTNISLLTSAGSFNISGRKDLAIALKIKEADLKGFAREKNLKVNFRKPDDLIPIVNHFYKF